MKLKDFLEFSWLPTRKHTPDGDRLKSSFPRRPSTELTEGAPTRQGLQPTTLSECRKINSRWGIPSTRAIAGAKLQSDILAAMRNP